MPPALSESSAGVDANYSTRSEKSDLVEPPGQPRSLLSVAISAYAQHLRTCYPVDGNADATDPFVLAIQQVANVLEYKARTVDGPAFTSWLGQYAKSLFWAHPDHSDPYSAGVVTVAGDIQIALLAWGRPAPKPDRFMNVVADIFGVQAEAQNAYPKPSANG